MSLYESVCFAFEFAFEYFRKEVGAQIVLPAPESKSKSAFRLFERVYAGAYVNGAPPFIGHGNVCAGEKFARVEGLYTLRGVGTAFNRIRIVGIEVRSLVRKAFDARGRAGVEKFFEIALAYAVGRAVFRKRLDAQPERAVHKYFRVGVEPFGNVDAYPRAFERAVDVP